MQEMQGGAVELSNKGLVMGILWRCDLDGPWSGPVGQGLQSWRSCRGDVGGWRHYWAGELADRPAVPAGAAWVGLQAGTDLHSGDYLVGVQAPFHYVVETDVAAGGEGELEAWYEQEHLPGLSRVPGCYRARRFLRLSVDSSLGHSSGDGALSNLPLYVASYDLQCPEVTESAPWLAVRHTDWSSRVRPLFRNTRRTLFIRPDLNP